MIVHYSNYLTRWDESGISSKIINYSDIAIEGFIFLFGFMIGNVYYPKFLSDPKVVIDRLLKRTLHIIYIHYLMIITISLPLAFFLGNKITHDYGFWSYLLKSSLFLTQPPLLHILPTFIPLLLLSILILFLLKKSWEILIILISIFAFSIGCMNPYIFSIGEKTIFPVILWQIYFVVGIIFGKNSFKGRDKEKTYQWEKHFLFSVITFVAISSFIYFKNHGCGLFVNIFGKAPIFMSKFPLNFSGLLYRGSILYVLISIIFFFWGKISQVSFAVHSVILMGRNSLTTFVIHIYFAELIFFLVSMKRFSLAGVYFMIVLNIYFTIYLLARKEANIKTICKVTAENRG